MDKQALAAQTIATFDEWLTKAHADALTINDLEEWSNPCCVAYDGSHGPACVLCPLEGTICEKLQDAYNAACDGRSPVLPLEEAKAILAPSLAAWSKSEDPGEDGNGIEVMDTGGAASETAVS